MINGDQHDQWIYRRNLETHLHSMACSSDLKHFGRLLRKACIEGSDSIAVPI